jgi:lysophospholipase L1-like esterase
VPDLAVFYDGANELGAQFRSGPSDDPIHLQSRAIEDRLRTTRAEATEDPGPPLRRVAEAYGETSAIAYLLRSSPVEVPVPGLQPTARMEAPWPDQEVGPEARGRAAARLHRRGVDLAASLGAGFGFEVASFWQPFIYSRDLEVVGEESVIGSWGTDPDSWRAAYGEALAGMHPSVTDLSGAFAGVDEAVYYDFVHTNERGAEVVARAIYDQLKPRLLALHDQLQEQAS